MKIVPTNHKAKIKWIAVLSDGSKMRNTKGFIHYAWEAECSCGWKTNTGGAIKAWIRKEIWDHKYIDHDYSMVFESKVGA